MKKKQIDKKTISRKKKKTKENPKFKIQKSPKQSCPKNPCQKPPISQKKNKIFFKSKLLFTQYTGILKTRAILSLSIIAISLTNYEYYHTQKSQNKYIFISISLTSITLNIISVFLYWLSIYSWGKYIRFIGWINNNTNIFFYNGLRKIFLVSFFLGVHINPFKEIIEDYDILEEEFYDYKKKQYEYFDNSVNDIVLIVKIIVHFYCIIYCFIRSCKYAQPSSNNYLNKSKKKFFFIFKMILNENFLFTTFMVFFLSVLLFSIIIRISENGFKHSIKRIDFLILNNQDINLKPIFYYYKNTFWNIVTTITTIGYGDIYVHSGLSRFLNFFISIFGNIVISFLLVAIIDFVKFNNVQEKVFDLFNAVNMNEKMKRNFDHALKKFILKKIRKKKKKKNILQKLKETLKRKIYKKKKKLFKIRTLSQFQNLKSNESSVVNLEGKIMTNKMDNFLKNELELKEIKFPERNNNFKSKKKIKLFNNLRSKFFENEDLISSSYIELKKIKRLKNKKLRENFLDKKINLKYNSENFSEIENSIESSSINGKKNLINDFFLEKELKDNSINLSESKILWDLLSIDNFHFENFLKNKIKNISEDISENENFKDLKLKSKVELKKKFILEKQIKPKNNFETISENEKSLQKKFKTLKENLIFEKKLENNSKIISESKNSNDLQLNKNFILENFNENIKKKYLKKIKLKNLNKNMFFDKKIKLINNLKNIYEKKISNDLLLKKKLKQNFIEKKMDCNNLENFSENENLSDLISIETNKRLNLIDEKLLINDIKEEDGLYILSKPLKNKKIKLAKYKNGNLSENISNLSNFSENISNSSNLSENISNLNNFSEIIPCKKYTLSEKKILNKIAKKNLFLIPKKRKMLNSAKNLETDIQYFSKEKENLSKTKFSKKYLINSKKEKKNKKYKFNSSQLILLEKAKKTISFYKNKNKKENNQHTLNMERYKILSTYYFSKYYRPKKFDTLKFLISILDDILEDFALFFFMKDERFLEIVRNMEKRDKNFFKHVLYLYPYAKLCYEKNKNFNN